MEYDINSFTNRIRETLYREFPYEGDYLKKTKHPNRPEHIRDVALWKNEVIVSNDGDTIIFDIGNDFSEENYPYYHILENTPVIRKKGKGTAKTKGTQASIQEAKNRDYERVDWNGKTFVKEYSRNVRGSRNRLASVSHWIEMPNGNKLFVNREANAYKNVHYKYIERILDTYIESIAQEFGLKTGRVKDTGLAEEFAMQEGTTLENVMEVFGSFMQ